MHNLGPVAQRGGNMLEPELVPFGRKSNCQRLSRLEAIEGQWKAVLVRGMTDGRSVVDAKEEWSKLPYPKADKALNYELPRKRAGPDTKRKHCV